MSSPTTRRIAGSSVAPGVFAVVALVLAALGTLAIRALSGVDPAERAALAGIESAAPSAAKGTVAPEVRAEGGRELVAPPASTASLPARGSSLRGAVVDRLGAPIAGALVRAGLQRQPWESAREVRTTASAADGSFELAGGWSDGARIVLGADHPDYVLAERRDLRWSADGTRAEPLRLERGARITGWVADTAGRPVADAELRFDADMASAFTLGDGLMLMQTGGAFETFRVGRSDAEGRFELAGLWPLTGRVVARAEGFAEAFSAPLDLTADPAPIGLELRAGHTLAVVVRAAEGPLAGAEVRVLGAEAAKDERVAHQRRAFVLRRAHTDGAGRIAAENLNPGRYSVEASAPGFASRCAEVLVPAPSAHVIELAAAGSIEVVLLGRPVAGSAVRVESAGTEGPAWDLAVADGERSLRIAEAPPGTYVARAGRAESAPFQVAAGRTVRVELVVAGVARVHGVVVDAETGAPVVGASVWRVDAEETLAADPVSLPVMFLEQLAEGAAPPGSAQTGDDGAFDLVGLEPGPHAIRARADGYAPATTPDFAMTGAGDHEFRVELTRGGRIDGRVETSSGAPLSGERVVARALPEGLLVWRATSDADGSFALEQLPAGSIEIALEPRRDYAQAHSGVDPFLQFDVARVVVRDGERAAATLVRDPAAALRGTVSDAAGATSGARVECRQFVADGATVRPLVRWTTSGADGAFGFDGLDPDEYFVEVLLADGAIPFGQRVQAAAGTETPLHLTAPAGIVRGRLVDADGAPVGGVELLLRATVDDASRPAVATAQEPVFSPPLDAGARRTGSRPFATAADGSFLVRGVPLGAYRLTAVGRSGPGWSRELELTAREWVFDGELGPGGGR